MLGGAGLTARLDFCERRLGGIEDREREVKDEIHALKLAVDRCERPLKNISKASWLVATALIGLLCGTLWKIFDNRIPPAPSVPWPGERLGSDRIQHPAPPKSEP